MVPVPSRGGKKTKKVMNTNIPGETQTASTAGWPAVLRSESEGDAPQFQEETAAEGAFGTHQPELTTCCLHSYLQDCKMLKYKRDF